MNGRQKQPWRRPPKRTAFRPPQTASDPLWEEQPARTSPGSPERSRNDRRPVQGENHRPFEPSREDSIWESQWLDRLHRRGR
jgi:hypothetical protein